MDKCQEKKCNNDATWAWQPFGPSDTAPGSFTSLGWHYRGFPVIKLCDDHKQLHQNNIELPFTYKRITYWFQGDKLVNETMSIYK